MRVPIDAFHLVTQVDTSVVLSLLYSLNVKKNRMMFMSTCVTKRKTPYVTTILKMRILWNIRLIVYN